MIICDLDYCHSAAPSLLVGGNEKIRLSAMSFDTSRVKGFVSDGVVDVVHDNKGTLVLEAEGLDQEKFDSVDFSVGKDANVRVGPNGGTEVFISSFKSLRLDGSLFVPF